MKYIRFLTILLALSCGFTPTINAMKKKNTKKKKRYRAKQRPQKTNGKSTAVTQLIPNIDQFLPKNAQDKKRLEEVQLFLNATSFQSRVIRQLRIFSKILPILSKTRPYVMTKDGKFMEAITLSSRFTNDIKRSVEKIIVIKDNINGDENKCKIKQSSDGKTFLALKVLTSEGVVTAISYHSLINDQKILKSKIDESRGQFIRKINLRSDTRLNELCKKFSNVPQGEVKNVMGWILHQFYSNEFFNLNHELPIGFLKWRVEKSKLSLFDYIAEEKNVEFLKLLPHFEKSCEIMEQLFLNYDDVNNQDEDEGKYNRFVADKMDRVVSMILDFLHNFGNYGEVLQNTYSHIHKHINQLITRSKISDKRIVRKYKIHFEKFFYDTNKFLPESISFNSEQSLQKDSTVITNVAKKHVVRKNQQPQKNKLQKKSSSNNEKQVNNNVEVKREIGKHCPDKKNISAENSDYKTSIAYDERVSNWYNKDFARTRSLKDYHHHCFSPLVAKYVIRYGRYQQWENRRYKNQQDDHYKILGEREYMVEGKKVREFVAFNCCLDPKGILYHQEANKKKSNSLFDEYSKLLDEYSKFSYWFQMQYPTIQESVQMKKQAKVYKVDHTEDEFGSKVIEENDHCIKIWDNILEMKITLYKLPYAQS